MVWRFQRLTMRCKIDELAQRPEYDHPPSKYFPVFPTSELIPPTNHPPAVYTCAIYESKGLYW